ncbi:MAG: redox-sensing transcriptional repressor Rex [Candidatus Auribacter fodinae]|jgi:redox-sensing transcriptional repressor|uniref:Redox-sensing transcriptional repressor Rex n=1 Tax=Candidatus Auribacter fodinae TaxID=2093366 RepID=A0A3A4R1E5_9BACT|nr:MAG: redox-sensing transcriptional repressor Rex [Candidatus Auribacter fodinae]
MPKIPDATIKRLSLYCKELRVLSNEGMEVVLSKDLANRLDLNPTQVRKDLSYFGKFGRRKRGYDVSELLANLSEILGITTDNKIGIFGLGNLGRALLNFKGFSVRGFYVAALFDVDPAKIGSTLFGKQCYALSDAQEIVKKEGIKIAVLAVPDGAAQDVMDVILGCGIKSILNFTQRHVVVPEDVMIRSVDFTDKLELLAYFSRSKSNGR